jgi:hypothetical protein
MSAGPFHAPGTALRECNRVPTMHSLPAPVMARLERLTLKARFGGRRATSADIISVLVLYCAPEDGDELAQLLLQPTPRDVREEIPQPLAFLPAQRRMLWLRAPISHRLNRLVDRVQELGIRTTRRDIVTALILHKAPRSRGELAELYDRLQSANAGDAGLPGESARLVLGKRPPRPGRRPIP